MASSEEGQSRRSLGGQILGLIDPLAAITLALMLAGGGVLFLIAWLNRDVKGALIGFNNLLSWMLAGAGALLLVDTAIRVVLWPFFAQAVSPYFTFIAGIVALSLGVGGLFDVGLFICFVAIDAGLLVWMLGFFVIRARIDIRDVLLTRLGIGWHTFLMAGAGFIGAGLLFYAAWRGRDAARPLIAWDDLDLALGVWVGACLAIEIVLHLVFKDVRPRRFSQVTWRLIVLFAYTAVGVWIKINPGLVPLVVFVGAAVVTLAHWLTMRGIPRDSNMWQFRPNWLTAFVLAGTLTGIGLLTLIAYRNRGVEDARIHYGNLGVAIGLWLVLSLLAEVVLRLLTQRSAARVILHTLALMVYAASFVALVIDVRLVVPVLMFGAALIIVVWRFGGRAEAGAVSEQ